MEWLADPGPVIGLQMIALARQAVALRPDDPACSHALSGALQQFGTAEETLSYLAEALQRFPADGELHVYRARAFAALGDSERAHDAARIAFAMAPANRKAFLQHSFQLLMSDAPAGRRPPNVAALDRGDAELANVELMTVYRANSLPELVSLSDFYLDLFPGHTSSTYYKALALMKLGQHSAARDVLSVERFVEVSMIHTPPGYPDCNAFCDALAAELLLSNELVPDPPGKSARNSLQSANIRRPGAPAVEALLRQIRASVDSYMTRLDDGAAGFARGRPKKARLRAWTSINGAAGHQVSHYHAAGWLSGVFYVCAPRIEPEAAFLGPIVLGAVNTQEGATAPPWGTMHVEPVPGRIILFPSYMPHATLPTGMAARRISVAFDVTPA